MTNVIFLAAVQDPTTSWPGTVIFGPGHLQNMTDEALVRQWRNEGKLSFLAPDVRQPRVTAIGTTTATIAWTLDTPAATTATRYGTTTAYGTEVAGTAGGGGAYTASLTGLTTGTLYHFTIYASGTAALGSRYTFTPDAIFTTL